MIRTILYQNYFKTYRTLKNPSTSHLIKICLSRVKFINKKLFNTAIN